MRKFYTVNILAVAALILASSLSFGATLTIRPNGAGYYSVWSSAGCTNDWECVDEATPSTSDYVYASKNNYKETFAFTDTGLSTGTINSITLYYYAKYYSSTKKQFEPMIRSGSTDYYAGSAFTATSSYATYSKTYATNPATGSAWTIAEVDALQAGMRTYTSGGGAYVAQVYAVVDYTIPDSCSDTDGGITLTTQGTASGYSNNNPYSYTDYCYTAEFIYEYYCNGTQSTGGYFNCANNVTTTHCSNGACV